MLQVLFAQRWTNVSVQQMQANVSVAESQSDNSDDELALRFTTDEAFNGGGCLQLSTIADGSRCVNRSVFVSFVLLLVSFCSHTNNETK